MEKASMKTRRALLGLGAAALGAAPLCASAESDAELARRLADPFAAISNLPLTYDYDRRFGTQRAGAKHTLVAAPIVPFKLNDDWNLITRTFIPMVHQRDVIPGTTQTGVTDIFPALFLSPTRSSAQGLHWGAGAVFQLRTATNDELANRKWGLGPTLFAIRQDGRWTYGFLADHLWSVAGDKSRPDYSQSFLQPLLSYTTLGAWTYSVDAESVYNWKSKQWSAPVSFTASKLVRLGGQPLQVGGGPRYWAGDPESGPHGWGLRLLVTLPFAS